MLLGSLLYNAWVQDSAVQTPQVAEQVAALADPDNPVIMPLDGPATATSDIPKISTQSQSDLEQAPMSSPHATQRSTEVIHIKTDVLDLDVDTAGGDIRRLVLLNYAENEDKPTQGFSLLEDSAKRYYIAQSGLASEQGPDIHGLGRALLKANASEFILEEGVDELIVDLQAPTKDGIHITKRFILKRGSYAIALQYLIDNKSTKAYTGSFYARLRRKPVEEKGGGFLGVQTFTGAAAMRITDGLNGTNSSSFFINQKES